MTAQDMVGGLDTRGVTPLPPFLAVCLHCGRERLVSVDKVPQCRCGARRWGLAGCTHCQQLVERGAA